MVSQTNQVGHFVQCHYGIRFLGGLTTFQGVIETIITFIE
jgi:hypothetical protein